MYVHKNSAGFYVPVLDTLTFAILIFIKIQFADDNRGRRFLNILDKIIILCLRMFLYVFFAIFEHYSFNRSVLGVGYFRNFYINAL